MPALCRSFSNVRGGEPARRGASRAASRGAATGTEARLVRVRGAANSRRCDRSTPGVAVLRQQVLEPAADHAAPHARQPQRPVLAPTCSAQHTQPGGAVAARCIPVSAKEALDVQSRLSSPAQRDQLAPASARAVSASLEGTLPGPPRSPLVHSVLHCQLMRPQHSPVHVHLPGGAPRSTDSPQQLLSSSLAGLYSPAGP